MTTLKDPEEIGGVLVLHSAVFWIAIAFSSFQVITAAFSPLSSQVVRAIHVGFVLLMIFTVERAYFKGPAGSVIGWVLGLVGFAFSFYHWIFESDLTARAGELTTADAVIGTTTIVLVFEAARRKMGWALPAICAMFLAYAIFGQYLPGAL